MDEISLLNLAWRIGDYNLIKFPGTISGRIELASVDGAYICLITREKNQQKCFILSSDFNKPKVWVSFRIDYNFEIWTQVFTKTRGLVLASSDGQISILTFSDQWKLNQQMDLGVLDGEIGALSTRDDLIIAGSAKGEVGAWSYNGTKVFQFQLPKPRDQNGNPYITYISIRQDKFLVGRDEGYYIYPTCFPNQGPYTPLTFKEKKNGVCEWATYNIEGTDVKWHTAGALDKYRPILPRYLKSYYEVYVPSLYLPTKEIIIWTFSGEKVRTIKLGQVTDFDNIQFMWCDFQHLFWATYGKEIYTIDFSTGLEGDCLFEPAECFGLSMSCQR